MRDWRNWKTQIKVTAKPSDILKESEGKKVRGKKSSLYEDIKALAYSDWGNDINVLWTEIAPSRNKRIKYGLTNKSG